MIGHITNSGGNNSLMKHDVVQGNNIVDLDLLRNFNGVPWLNRENFIYISNIFLNIKQRNEKNHAINMFREVSISNDIISVKFYRNEKIECACDFMMDKDAQGYIDLSDLDLTSCHFKGDVISEVSFYRQIYNMQLSNVKTLRIAILLRQQLIMSYLNVDVYTM